MSGPRWFSGRVRRSGTAVASGGGIANTGIMYFGVEPRTPLVAARERLAELVAVQWRDEAIRRTLYNPESMPVSWHTPDLVFRGDDPGPLVEAFRGRLVIIGDAGSGKTTLAVQLVRDLLDVRKDRPDDPVPVLLAASTWDPGFLTVRQWVAHSLVHDYPALGAREYGLSAHTDLVDRAWVLPVVDGLDELPEPALASLLRSLDDFSDRDDRLILTCRTDQYRNAVRGSAAAAAALVVEPDPLTPSAAADYLERCLVAEVPAALRDPAGPPEALAEVVSSPLGLWLVRISSAQTDPRDLVDPERFADASALREHLYAALIPALVRLHQVAYAPADVTRWLGYLADLVGDRTDLAWWRLARTTGNPTAVFRLLFGAITAVVATASLVVIGSWLIPEGSALGGVVFGVSTGMGAGYAADRWAMSEPGHVRQRLTDLAGLLRAVGSTAAVYLSAAVPIGVLLASLGLQPLWVLAAALFGGSVLYAIGTGITEWAETPAATDQATSPPRHLVADRRLNLLRLLVFSVLVGLAVLVTITAVYGIVEGLAFGAFAALGAAVAGGLLAGDHHAWLAYLAAVGTLSRRRLLPRKLMPFLDDAHRLGLLRAVGSVYQFRHAGLQDYLARTYRNRS
ncbi:NACHT domain-containing protein [Umezawaea sp. NPDC059074]|uniref:NACHT domain-containing protein n=1 Tax=Umezawaea sp. NPDC059074 TaxID=3346716 RepID=UPI0036A7A296